MDGKNKSSMCFRLLLLSFVLAVSLQAWGQKNIVPGSLRVDLLRSPEKIYQGGFISSLSLAEALHYGNRTTQYSTVNSRFPLFSWNIAAGAKQRAYQIELATQAGLLERGRPDVWVSGRISDPAATSALYSGPALLPSKVYYWRVRIWKGKAKRNSTSAIESFCTGANLKDYDLPSFTLTKTIERPVSIKYAGPTSVIYDFGKDSFAQPELSILSSHSNDTLLVRLGEMLGADGRVERKPPGFVRYRQFKVPVKAGLHNVDLSIAPDKRNTGQMAILMPAYIGEVLPFRYMEISGDLEANRIDSVSRAVVSNDFDDSTATFASSDTSLNQLWDLCKHTIKATSFTGYYIDGDRERIPYEADALINQLSHYSVDAEFNMAKRTIEYLIYHPTWPTEWSIQNVLIAMNDYLYSGDLRLVRHLYPELKAKLLMDLAREDGLLSTRTGKQTSYFLRTVHFEVSDSTRKLKDIVDWPHPGGLGLKPGSRGETDGFVFSNYNSVVNAYYYVGLRSMQKLANALNLPGDAKLYEREATQVRVAFQKAFVDKESGLILDGEGVKHSSLHANLFALAFGLVETERVMPVVSFIKSRGMACSVYPAQFLLDALIASGETEYALKLLTSRDKRS